MKMNEYPLVTALTQDNFVLVDGSSGTKRILMSDALLSMMGLISPTMHRQIFRGKNLGSTVTSEQKTAIQNGTFENLWLGDYWEVSGVKWRIADFDYWYGCGDTPLNQHHLMIVPDTGLYTAKMNESSTTTGGYVGSGMYTSGLATAKSTISGIFGALVINHREYLINAVSNGAPSSGAWTDSTVELMNELMVYGSYIYCAGSTGSVDVKRYTNSKVQLALFAVNPNLIQASGGYWLRDISTATHWARVDTYGGATNTGGANAYGVRPIFAIG